MRKRRFVHDPDAERRQLLVLALGSGALAVALFLMTHARVAPVVLGGIAVLGLTGASAYRWIGRDIFVVFTVATRAMSSVVSLIALALAYFVGIFLMGGILRLVRMDRMKRRYQACRQIESMFYDPPATDVDSFRRQS
jgi:hypothetical protein